MQKHFKFKNDRIYFNGKLCRSVKNDGIRAIALIKYNNVKSVIKYDFKYSSESLNQSTSEWKLWKKMPKEDRKYFQKIIVYIPGWIVQEFFIAKIGRPTARSRKIIRKLADKYNLYDIDPDECGRNWCIRSDGMPIIFDFGV